MQKPPKVNDAVKVKIKKLKKEKHTQGVDVCEFGIHNDDCNDDDDDVEFVSMAATPSAFELEFDFGGGRRQLDTRECC